MNGRVLMWNTYRTELILNFDIQIMFLQWHWSSSMYSKKVLCLCMCMCANEALRLYYFLVIPKTHLIMYLCTTGSVSGPLFSCASIFADYKTVYVFTVNTHTEANREFQWEQSHKETHMHIYQGKCDLQANVTISYIGFEKAVAAGLWSSRFA